MHQPVLLDEVVTNLIVDIDGIYIDGTFGRGGHTQAILGKLSTQGLLIGIDQDPEAIKAGQNFCNDKRFRLEQGSFANMESIAAKYNIINKVSGILLDLGVSSPQLDDPLRGFSFLREGPLDMRMDTTQGIDAATWINRAKDTEIAHVLKTYGEERFAKRIAKAIVDERHRREILTTTQLADVVAKANPKWELHKHPATRSFQAIRIFINNELNNLEKGLDAALDILKPGGRLAVISFHSLEDRIVKHFIRDQERGQVFPKNLPITEQQQGKRLRKIGKAITADPTEVKKNPRARSAILRIAEKII